MIEHEGQPEITEKGEYSFEQGVEQIMGRIHSLLSREDNIVVAIAGPSGGGADISVGKTILAGKLGAECMQLDIPLVGVSSLHGVDNILRSRIDDIKRRYHSAKCVVLLDAMGSPGGLKGEGVVEQQEKFRTAEEGVLQKYAKQAGLPLSKIDVRVLIYRPDRPPTEGDRKFADIVIKNDQAVDKNESIPNPSE